MMKEPKWDSLDIREGRDFWEWYGSSMCFFRLPYLRKGRLFWSFVYVFEIEPQI
jgi:hypothetical protein